MGKHSAMAGIDCIKDKSLLLTTYLKNTHPTHIWQMQLGDFGKPNEYKPEHGDNANTLMNSHWAEFVHFLLPNDDDDADPYSCHRWARCDAVLASTGDYNATKYLRVCIPKAVYDAARAAATPDGAECLVPDPKYIHGDQVTVFVKLRNWRQTEGKAGEEGTRYLLSVANGCNVQELEINALQRQAKQAVGGISHITGVLQFRFTLVVHTKKGQMISNMDSIDPKQHKCVLNMVVAQFAAEGMESIPEMDVGTSGNALCVPIMPKTSANIIAAAMAAGLKIDPMSAQAPSR